MNQKELRYEFKDKLGCCFEYRAGNQRHWLRLCSRIHDQPIKQYSTSMSTSTTDAAQKAKTTCAQTYYDRLDDLGRTHSVSAIVTYGMMYSHSSAVRKRPVFPKTTKVAGEYADGVYNQNLQQWFGR